MLQEKHLQEDSPEYFFVAGMDKYFPTSFWWTLSVLLPYWEEISSCLQNDTGLGGEGSRVGGQDRVGSPCVNQEILRPTCHIQLYPWLQPHDGYL